MTDDGNGMETGMDNVNLDLEPDSNGNGSEIPDPGDPRGRELDMGRPEKRVLGAEMPNLPEYRVRLLPTGKWEVEVWSQSESVLLNKISRKAELIRGEVQRLRGRLADFDQLFNSSGPAETSGVKAHAEAVHILHREWLQVMDIARQLRIAPGLVDAACSVSAPAFHWGERE